MTPSEFLPARPRLHRSYHVLTVAGTDELQLQSEARMLRLRPVDASRLLHTLIPLLDGRHTVQDIVRQMTTFDESQVLESLQQLKDARVLEEGATEDATGSSEDRERHSPQLTLFSHLTTDPHRVQARLAESRVAVLGRGPLGSQVAGSLAEIGISHLRSVAVDDNSEADIVAAVNGTELLVVAAEPRRPDLLQQINARCLQTGTTWMPFGITAWEGYAGPTVVPHQTACYTCCELRTKANLVHYEPLLVYEQHIAAGRLEARTFGRLPQFARAISEMAAIEVVRLLTHVAPPATVGRLFTFDFLTFEAQFHDVLKLPRCPACGEPSRHKPVMKPWSE
jgi:bacteriocin biosynthesis cyclodehydratase domain-containing protein